MMTFHHINVLRYHSLYIYTNDHIGITTITLTMDYINLNINEYIKKLKDDNSENMKKEKEVMILYFLYQFLVMTNYLDKKYYTSHLSIKPSNILI